MANVLPDDAPTILRFLTELADPRNGELLGRFYEDPPAVMRQYGLTDGEQAIVLSGDLQLVQAALDSAAIAAGITIPSAVGVVVVYSPPPRPRHQNVVGTF